jgi:hypothetical protein
MICQHATEVNRNQFIDFKTHDEPGRWQDRRYVLWRYAFGKSGVEILLFCQERGERVKNTQNLNDKTLF